MDLPERERRERLELLFERHYAAVLAFALRRGPGSVAEDVASETFVVAWRRMEDIPMDALPWLYGVARRVLANQRRGDVRRQRLEGRLQAGFEAAVVIAGAADGRELLEAIARLPEREREALMLVAWEGLSSAQAAVAAGCTRVALRARLYRARRRLAGWLPDISDAAPAVGQRASSLEIRAGESEPITDRSCR